MSEEGLLDSNGAAAVANERTGKGRGKMQRPSMTTEFGTWHSIPSREVRRMFFIGSRGGKRLSYEGGRRLRG